MASHGQSRRTIEAQLSAHEPFKRSGFAMWAMQGATTELGRLPEPYRSQYETAARAGILAYTVKSYATPIAWVTTGGAVVIPDVTHSQTTTQHQRTARVCLS